MLETPVLLLVYNRPALTQRVFEAVRRQRPERLFVVADGPRADRPGDDERCRATRTIFDQVDWDCRVERNFAERNLGCRDRVASGISWFFDRVERGIVLEDDCVPHGSFFAFCETLLRRYEHDDRVMHVSGANFQHGRRFGDGSYYYSSYPSVWGWATWKRAWARYDLEMKDYPRFVRQGGLERRLPAAWERWFWLGTFQMMHTRLLNTWDHAWTFAIWSHGGVALTSNRNLVTNVGFGAEGTHTTRPNPACIELPLEAADDPVINPSECGIATEADRLLLRRFLRFYGPRARARVAKHAWRAWRTRRAA